MQKITNFLLFEGNAEEAMNFYVSLFENSKVEHIIRYKAGEAGTEGTVMHAKFSLNGQEFVCIDSGVKHQFTFTAAMSLYVACDSEAETDKFFRALSVDGAILMPLGSYPFSKKYAWINDRYGVSWQLSYNPLH
jgi:predicted 3-demethylubiquinone-9 3-methyltransferase (glyoxalase superfamily)